MSGTTKSGWNLVIVLLTIGVAVSQTTDDAPQATTRMLLQAEDADHAGELVASVGGRVTHELGIIDAVAAPGPGALRCHPRPTPERPQIE